MKHTVKVTFFLILIFFVSQLVGLGLINESSSVEFGENGTLVLEHDDTIIGERPDFQGYQSFLYLAFGIVFGTIILLILIKFRQKRIWKIWFSLAIFIGSAIALGVLLPWYVAAILAAVIVFFKVCKPNVLVHNISEVLIYSGIAVLLVPLFDVFWMVVVMVLIAIYDAIAVWKSKHMVSMAKFQTESKVFAGLMLPYDKKKDKIMMHRRLEKLKPSKKGNIQTAILGGGDIAFPLLFTGAVMEGLIRSGIPKFTSFLLVLIIVITATAALTGLFVYSKKGKFYPAMPFLSAGCFVGWGIMHLLLLVI